MSDLHIFNNPDFGDIRIVERDGEPWFVGKDIAQALGYKDTKNALKSHVDTEDKGGWQITTPSEGQKMTIINESGVYSLIFSSKLEKAQQFKRWVTAVVLPSIRKTGGYLTPAAEGKLDAILAEFQRLAERVTALEEAATDPFQSVPALPAPLPEGKAPPPQPPGRDYLRRWMRTASSKLDLMGSRYNMSHNAVLHWLYGTLEEAFDVALEDERLRIMEEYNLEECSTLKAVFYEEDFREYLEETIDYNLAPENRGW